MSRMREERHGFWRQVITEQEQSGLSVRAFCRQRVASEPGFYQWRNLVRSGCSALVTPVFALSGTT
jgi:hypothetical protein